VTSLTRSQPVALLGEAPPRVLVAPPATRANSWEDVADLSATFGITLDGWQEVVLQAAMGERTDGTWAARRVGLSVPRQNGKSQLLVARALAGALLFGERKIVISAHQQDTARESFSKLMEIIEDDRNASLRARIKPNGIMQALNREAVKFNNGATIQFKARSGAGARGFSSDCLMLDEAQILSQRAWVSINSTMSAMPNPQIWLLGTPPTPEDDGEVFGSVRSSAMSGQSTAAAWCEWAADPAADPALELTRWSANPAWNVRINHEVVDGEFETYPRERFALDRLGIWATEGADGVIDWAAWKACKAPAGPVSGPIVLAVETSLDRSQSVIVAVATFGELPRVKVLQSGAGTGWVAAAVAKIATDHSDIQAVVIDSRAQASALIEPISEALDLAHAQVDVVVTSTADMVQACGVTLETIRDQRIVHGGEPSLDAAVRGATQRDVGDNAWAWSRRKGGPAAAPLVAMSLALWKWLDLTSTDYDITDSFG
jgi:protein-L-isoaspartate O-methyltransferase